MAELEKVKNAARIEDQNVTLVRQFFKALDAQDYNGLKELLAPGAILHGTAPQEDITADNSAQLLRPLFQALPDLAHSVEDIFAKGDKVVARALIQATHKGELMGIPPTGNRLGYYQFAIFQIIDGKIKEGWRVTDSLGMMSQLGMELKPIRSKVIPAETNGSLEIEAGLMFQSGDIKPVAPTTFYLLDGNLTKVLRTAGYKPADGKTDDRSLLGEFHLAFAFPAFYTEGDKRAALIAAITPHVIKKAETDFKGKAVFKSVPSGTYYIVGVGHVANSTAIWNLKVIVSGGISSISLDQNNADMAI
jgi:steroid delta-isomerase-like uncharacterized protein